MENIAPKISIVCPSYNHGNYIAMFVESVLAQTEQCFELIIIDDNSTDNNLQQLAMFNDPRIKLIKHSYNWGMAGSFNDGAKLAKADTICFIASDDLLEPNYLASVLQTFGQNPAVGVVYIALQHIDINNSLLPSKTMLPVEKDRFEILREFFLGINILPSPGMAIKKQALLPLLPLPVGLLQCTDWQMNILLLINHDIALLNKPLIKYRVIPTSASRIAGVNLRESLEIPFLMDAFLTIKDVNLLRKIFPQELASFVTLDKETIPYILGRMALQSTSKSKRSWGYQTIVSYLSKDADNLAILHKLYNFSFKDLLHLTPQFTDERKVVKEKMKKYKRLSNVLIVLLIISFSLLLICLL